MPVRTLARGLSMTINGRTTKVNGMKAEIFDDPGKLHEIIVVLRAARERRKSSAGRPKRTRLSGSARNAVLKSTAGRCHICGGEVDAGWQADHVLAHSGGGSSAHENFLPAHAMCNNYRWDYLPEEFQLILKLGVWARTEIENQSVTGRAMAACFAAKEARVRSRRVSCEAG